MWFRAVGRHREEKSGCVPLGIKAVQSPVSSPCPVHDPIPCRGGLSGAVPRLGEGQEGLRKLSSSSWCDEELDAGGIPPWDSHPSLPRIFPIPEAGLWFTRRYLALLRKTDSPERRSCICVPQPYLLCCNYLNSGFMTTPSPNESSN